MPPWSCSVDFTPLVVRGSDPLYRPGMTASRPTASAVPSELLLVGGNHEGEGNGVPEALEAYVAACAPRGVKPNGAVLTLFRTLDVIVLMDFRENYLGDVGTQALCAALPHLPRLRALSLADNGITNAGLATLCDAMDKGCPQLNVLDLNRNMAVTRAGGQRLLNTAGRCNSLACVNLASTRVTLYFETRIQRHAANHYGAMTDAERTDVDSLVIALAWRDGGHDIVPLSRGPGSYFEVPPSRLLRNVDFDEAIMVVDGEVDSDCVSEVFRPMAPSSMSLEAETLHARTPDFAEVDEHGPYTITRSAKRTVYGHATPTTNDLTDLFACVALYEPKEIELPTKFLWPGKMEYMAAVHAPDPMLAPSMPEPFIADDSAGGGNDADLGMYWNFFHTANRPTSRTAPDGTNDDDPEEQHRLYEKHRQLYALQRVNDAVCCNVNLLKYRSVSGNTCALVHERQPLSTLIDDPGWVPTQPTRGPQVDEYNAVNKLKYNTVTAERFQVAGMFQREFYLQRVIRHGITERLTSGALNSRGTMLATSSYDMTCKVWDADSGKRLLTLSGHEGHLSDCAFNRPVCDKIITASFDRTLKVWRVSDGQLLYTLRGHDLEVVAVAVSHDGRRVASGGMDDLAILWDIESGEELCTLTGHTGEVVSVDFSPKGDMVVTGSMDESVRVWNAKDGTPVQVLTGHTAEIGQVRFNTFGNMVLSGSIDCTCRLWDVSTGMSKVLRGHTGEVVDCCFSPTGWQCASVSDDNTVRVWDVLTGGCTSMMTGHTDGVCHVHFNKTGSEVLTGSIDMTARIWSVDTGECKQVLRGHRSVVLVSYNADCDRIMTISKDNSVRIWRQEPETNSLLHNAAVAICQHPTLYKSILEEEGMPEHLQKLLTRVHRRVFHAEREAVSTPLPVAETPYDDEDGSRSYMMTPLSPTPAGATPGPTPHPHV